MLGWLRQIANDPPIVLMIRHPLQVASSWLKLGWGKEVHGNRSDFDIVTSQKPFLNDLPVIGDAMKRIDPHDFVENVVFQWCIHSLVPSHHLSKDQAYALFYERLLCDPENEMARLFHYLSRPFNPGKVRKAMKRSSSTNFLGRDFSKGQSLLINGWKDEWSIRQIDGTNYILTAFGLNDSYDKDGYPTGARVSRD